MFMDTSRGLPPDCRDVVRAAGALELREIDFFRLAHRFWYGRRAERAALDRSFGRYLTQRQVPFWVRHTARQVLADAEAGSLDPRRYGAGRYERQGREPGLGRFSLASVAVAMLIFGVIAAAGPDGADTAAGPAAGPGTGTACTGDPASHVRLKRMSAIGGAAAGHCPDGSLEDSIRASLNGAIGRR